uniref:Uncharacterized protein n=1 Tax=Rhizophora mucronata TaxID=61149 RepID=A0A2P2J2Y3_RHIMU
MARNMDDGVRLVPFSLHVGRGVLDPPLFPTRTALLNLYFWMIDDDEDADDEHPRFLIFPGSNSSMPVRFCLGIV